MKLDFETNLSSVSLVEEEFHNDINLENSLVEASPLLKAGIEAAQEGNRTEARLLLLRVTEIEPGNEDAWMRLASVSEYPEELLGFLDRVLEINPDNKRALEWTKSTQVLLSKNFVERGTHASKDENKDFAKQCFLQALAHDAENETAWLWLASVSDSAEEKTAHLQKVLNLNPKNENAIVLLKSVKNQKVNVLLQNAVSAAVADKPHAAKQMLEEVLHDAPELVEAWVLKSFLVESFEEKINCFEKILDIDDEHELANVNWTALLDITANADSQAQFSGEEEISALEEDDFEELKPALDFSEMNEDFQYSAVSPDAYLEEIQPNFEAQTGDEEIFDADELPGEVRLFEENDASFADLDSGSEKTEVFEDAAQNYSDYSQSQFFQEVSKNDSQYAGSEVLIPQDTLPSYFESEDIAAPIEAEENDYSSEFIETEQEVLAKDYLESKEPAVSVDEEKISEEISADAVFNEESFNAPPDEILPCPFCSAEEEAQAFVCGSCRTMLTLSDLEMLLAHQDADQEILRQAVERMEEEKNRRDFSIEELKLLAIGQINLKNLRQGCAYLEEASQINPNDVVLSSQVNSLKIRLAEIEDQQSVHDSMPKNRKILVVDDSATVRKLISSKLEKSGHEVFCAIDGIDALEKIKETVPDLILLDINMPRMDGYQVCKLIRSNDETKDVPIVMISGKDGFFDKVRGRMAGTTGYITKPFGPETLMRMLETYIV